MLFLEIWFWIFAAVSIPLYLICPNRLKLYVVLGASVVFHFHFAGPAGMAPILVLAVMTYFAALLPRPRATRSTAVTVVVCSLVGALVFYKYAEFLLQNAIILVDWVSNSAPSWMVDWRAPIAPLGISFFTFEFVHYLYEVRVVGRPPIRNPFHFSVFAIFFPTLAAGPIKRFPDFVPQLDDLRNPEAAVFWAGVRRVIRGLFKKVCIADLLVEYVHALEATQTYNGPLVVVLALLQGYRIYYDFSGYTDMAIGLAQMMNLRVPENFDRPYFSTSLQEFWRRWHMSLSLWIRDYVYIPLGGNRARRGFNLLTAMVLCGLWHGASWNFALWGLWHGAGLAVESALRRQVPSLFGEGFAQKALGWAVCYAFVMYGWLIFFYPIGTVYQMTLGLLDWRSVF